MTQSLTSHVFISYSGRDEAAMQRIKIYLQNQKIKIWEYKENLIPGTPVWEIEVEKAIVYAAAVIVLLSPDSKESIWVIREVTLAEQHNKRIFPVMVRGDENSSTPFRLITNQRVDIRENEDSGLNSLYKALTSYLTATKTLEMVTETTQPLIISVSNEIKRFVDQNKHYQIQIPADWIYRQSIDSQSNYYYIDTFTSPDGGAVIESIVYNDGTAFTGNDNGKFALYLLNTFYSKTGKEGDIKILNENTMKDGSRRLIWTSKLGHYKGISFFELCDENSSFLLFTINWGDKVDSKYSDILNKIVDRYNTRGLVKA